STSGRLMPEYYIRQFFEKSPEEVFERVGYSGDHSRTIAQVQAGAYDVGAVNYTVWDNELAEGKIDLNRLRIIWTTPTYPDYQWTIRGDVDARFGEGFTEKVQQALLAMKDESLLASFPRQRFVPASNEDYAPIQATGEAIGILDEN
ncbi:MAG: PhnD/SsuA/transferrin family substrate-binding protein, partial [Oleibacter sp.]|nr:PhnD/SsuA/transferrin family substrate-binding protein [Thalassolituus sp.]